MYNLKAMKRLGGLRPLAVTADVPILCHQILTLPPALIFVLFLYGHPWTQKR